MSLRKMGTLSGIIMNSNASGLARARLFAAASSLALGLLLTSPVLAAQDETNFDIPAQPMSDAIAEFSRQSRINVLVPSTVTTGKTSNAVAGEMAADEALRLLIDGTDLNVSLQNDGAFLISAVAPEVVQPEKGRSFRMAQLVEETDRDGVTEADDEPETRKKDEITVTGTLIKGIAQESSPVQTFNREDILTSGATTTEQFIRLLPQNFGGGSSEFARSGLPNDVNAGANGTRGTSANLRGLGSRGTLVLLNGSRMAPTSEIGDFVDLSLIPMSALERVDVLTDGASSIYGGDAVAGVINFILRDDFDGAETSLRYGTVTSGGMDEYRISQTLGTSWQSGNVLATYEFFDRDNLTLADRPGIGNVTTGTGEPISDRNEFLDLLPTQNRHSAVAFLRQELSPGISVSVSSMFSDRSSTSTAFSNEAANIFRSEADSRNLAFNLGSDITLSENWSLTVDGTYSQVHNNETVLDIATADATPSHRVSRSGLWSANALFNGQILTLPAGPLKVAFGGSFRQEEFKNEINESLRRDGDRDVAAVFGELAIPLVGEGFAIPLIRRFDVNVSGRFDDYSDFGSTFNPKVGFVWSPVDNLNLRGTYGTSFAPPTLGRIGALDRVANVLPYANILSALGIDAPDPALATVDYMIAAGTGTDLKAETSRTFTAGLDYHFTDGPGTWSASASYYDVTFEGRLGSTPIPGNNPNLAPHIAFDDPTALPEGTIVFFPTQAEISALVETLSRAPVLRSGATLENVGMIDRSRLVRNLASTATKGIDARIDYLLEADFGTVTAGLNANYILEFENQATDTTPKVDVVSTLYNPVDFRLRGNVGFSRNGFAANAYVNYTDSYKTDDTDLSVPVSSWTTVDVFMSYGFSQKSGILQGASLNLSVTNIFDQNPPEVPSYGALNIAGYDPTNASPLKRFIAFELRKTF
ncbi:MULTISPECIES: TonB-dependent receptor [Hyphomonas]|uniref:TonB-dependent receptor n=1 Tax=Hyphomonas TaxID=85 RepID=UPI0023542139|nr:MULTISPECIES: TonB-dependent receptor [Hyphomonas]